MMRNALTRILNNVCGKRIGYYPSDSAVPGDFVGPRPSRGYPRHSHRYPELVQLIDGRAKLNLSGKSERMKETKACLLLPGCIHSEGFIHPRQPYKLMWCVFGPSGINFFVSAYDPSGGFYCLPDRLVGITQNDQLLWNLVSGSKPAESPLARAEAQALLIQSLLAALKYMDEPTPQRSNPRRTLVEQTREYIERHFTESLSVEDLAQMARCTPNYLNTIFRKFTGRPIHRFIIDHRLNLAKTWLTRETMTVKEISYKLGFNDPLYFSRLFRKRFGVPPTAFSQLPR